MLKRLIIRIAIVLVAALISGFFNSVLSGFIVLVGIIWIIAGLFG